MNTTCAKLLTFSKKKLECVRVRVRVSVYFGSKININCVEVGGIKSRRKFGGELPVTLPSVLSSKLLERNVCFKTDEAFSVSFLFNQSPL